MNQPKKNPLAVALGKMAKGVKKQVSAEESKRRADSLAQARLKRWPKKKEK